MTRSILLLTILVIALLGQASEYPQKSPVSPLVEAHLDTLELQRAWTKFAQAVKKKDHSALNQLSAACIRCSDCVTNTKAEAKAFETFKQEHPDTWYDSLYGPLSLIPAEAFWRQDGPLIFDARTTLRLLDPTKLRYAENDHTKEVYVAPCFMLPAQASSSHVGEVLLTYKDPYPVGEGEGMQQAFAFVKTKQGYKFCGYSTIP